MLVQTATIDLWHLVAGDHHNTCSLPRLTDMKTTDYHWVHAS